MSTTPRTVVELVDTSQTFGREPFTHVAREVRVNGMPVLLAEDGVSLTYGPAEATIVTLRILATEVHFTPARP